MAPYRVYVICTLATYIAGCGFIFIEKNLSSKLITIYICEKLQGRNVSQLHNLEGVMCGNFCTCCTKFHTN